MARINDPRVDDLVAHVRPEMKDGSIPSGIDDEGIRRSLACTRMREAPLSIGVDGNGVCEFIRRGIPAIGSPLHPIDTTSHQGVSIVGQNECAIRHKRYHLQIVW